MYLRQSISLQYIHVFFTPYLIKNAFVCQTSLPFTKKQRIKSKIDPQNLLFSNVIVLFILVNNLLIF